MLVEHAFTERSVLLPLEASILLFARYGEHGPTLINKPTTHHKRLAANSSWEVTIERDTEVVGIVPLVVYDMLQDTCLMNEHFSQSRTDVIFVSICPPSFLGMHSLVERDLGVLIHQFARNFESALPSLSFAYTRE